MPLASITTMGCKVNQYESYQILEKLKELGCQIDEPGKGEILVLNGCVVTGRAEKEALMILRRFRRENPQSHIIVVGCLARHLGSDLLERHLADAVLKGESDLGVYVSDLLGEYQKNNEDLGNESRDDSGKDLGKDSGNDSRDDLGKDLGNDLGNDSRDDLGNDSGKDSKQNANNILKQNADNISKQNEDNVPKQNEDNVSKQNVDNVSKQNADNVSKPNEDNIPKQIENIVVNQNAYNIEKKNAYNVEKQNVYNLESHPESHRLNNNIKHIANNDERQNSNKIANKIASNVDSQIFPQIAPQTAPQITSQKLTNVPRQKQSRAFLKIQDGCNMSCSFCIIPSLRGRSRSIALDEVLLAISSYQKMGYQEIVLTGIHLGSWGRDRGSNLLSLLKELECKLKPDPDNFRLRLSSIEPTEVRQLIDAFTRFPFLAPHLHIPLQSGSDKVLRDMLRPYKAQLFQGLVEDLLGRTPGLSIGTDILVGYPTESHQDFLDTLNLAKQLPLSYHHIFPFSLRSKTKASEIKEQVPLKVRKERALIFKNLDKLKRREFRDAQVGKSELVLVESGVHKLSGRRKGISGTYLRVLIDDSVNSFPKSLTCCKLSDAKNPWGLLEAK